MISASNVRPGDWPPVICPSSVMRDSCNTPASSAWWISPRRRHCEELVGDDTIGECEDIDFQLAFVRAVGSDCDDQAARFHPSGADEWRAAGRDRDDDIGIGDGFLECSGDDCVHAGCRDVRDAHAGCVVPAAPHFDRVECAHLCEELDLIPRLRARADHAHCTNRFARQVLCRDGARGCGAKIGDVTVVEKDRSECAGAGIEYHDDAAVHLETECGVAGEARGEFHRVPGRSVQVAGV